MVEKLKKLDSLYKTIVVINREIMELNESFVYVQQLRNSIIGEELENNLKNIENIFRKNLRFKKEKKKENEDAFKKLVWEIFGFEMEFDGSSIVFKTAKINDSFLEKYKIILDSYVKLFNTDGISDNYIIAKIQNIVKDLVSITLKLWQLMAIVKQAKISCFEETNLFSMLTFQIEDYKDIIIKYQKLLKYLIANDKIPCSEASIKYIISNTSLMPLVFANNNFSSIKRNNSLRRLVNCQFHADNNHSLSVSLDKNFFRCFGCGIAGNQIDYLQKLHNISYMNAIYLLAEIYLIDLPENPFRSEENKVLVNKYRDVLISDNYKDFLIKSMNKNPNCMDIYLKLLTQIERVKSGLWDSSFQFEAKPKRFLNMSRTRGQVKELSSEKNYMYSLPF